MCCPPITPKSKTKITIVKDWLGSKGLHYIESLTEGENRHAAPSKVYLTC